MTLSAVEGIAHNGTQLMELIKQKTADLVALEMIRVKKERPRTSSEPFDLNLRCYDYGYAGIFSNHRAKSLPGPWWLWYISCNQW